jgi:hypothetical protein
VEAGGATDALAQEASTIALVARIAMSLKVSTRRQRVASYIKAARTANVSVW